MVAKELSQIKTKVRSAFINKSGSTYEYNHIKSLLEKIKKEDNEFYLLNSAKLEIKYNNYLEAYRLLDILKANYPKNASLYYILYKLDMEENKLEQAKKDLLNYKNLSENENDITLPLLALQIYENRKYNQINEVEIKKVESHLMYRLPEEIKDDYNLVITYLKEENYKEAKTLLKKIQEKIEVNNYRMEVYTIIKIVDNIIKLNDDIKLNLENTIETKEYHTFDFSNITSSTFLDFINKIAKEDTDFAIELLHKYSYKILNREAYQILEKKLKEIKYINHLENRYDYYKYNAKVKEAIAKEEYELAYDLAEAGYYVTKSITFIYYMGQSLYKAGFYIEAEKLFEEYLKQGGKKYLKANVLLTASKAKLGKLKEANYLVEKRNKLIPYLDKDFKADTSFYLEKEEEIQEEIGTDFTFDKIELVKTKEEVEDFKKQIAMIQTLYLEGNKKKADAYLKKLKAVTKEEKQAKNDLEHNKLLYLNKARKGI